MPQLPESVLPAAAQRLFAHYRPTELASDDARIFVTLRLADEGDREDLRWLTARLGEDALRRTLERHGPRQLSRRSLAFWRRVLDLPPVEAARSELWPR